MLIVGLLAVASIIGCRGARGNDDQRKDEIAVALKSFMEAFNNNDAATLPGLFSNDCPAEQMRQLQGLSQLVHQGMLSGRYQLTVNTDSFVVETKGDRATVPIDQPDGALSATATVSDQPIATMTLKGGTGPVENPLDPFKTPIEFVRQNGAWKVHNCGELFRHGDETPATAIP
jgi:hypothetical protein